MILLLAALQLPPVRNFPLVEHPGASTALRQTVDKLCGDAGKLDRDGLLSREDKISMDAHDSKASAATWISLGCVRGALEGDGALSRGGLEMVAGDSWALGGEHAMLEALRIEPTNARAADVLATLVLDDLDADAAAVAGVLKAYSSGVATPAVLRVCSEHSLRANDLPTTRKCALQALARGLDSTWHLLRLTRISFRENDTINGGKQFFAAVAAAHDTGARGEVAWHLQWFLTPSELNAAQKVSGPAAGILVRDRMIERDVRDGQPAGARLAEHFKRLDYVLAHFRLHIPVRIRKAGGLQLVTPENRLKADSIRNFCEPGLLPAQPFRDYHRWQSEIDDRGVVWLRFGKPTRIVQAHPVCADTIIPDDLNNPKNNVPASNTREAWLYEIDGKGIVLNFESEKSTGSVEATRLVTGVLGSYLCGIDTIRCGLTNLSIAQWYATHTNNGTKPATDMVQPEDVEHVRQDDRGFISIATTTDDNSPRGERNVQMMSHLHRLWDPLTGTPLAMVTYAVPTSELSVQSANGRRTTVIDLELRQWDAGTERWRDTSFARHFEIPDTSVKRPNLVGFFTVPSSPGVSAWSLVATQPDQRRGRVYDVSGGGLGAGPVALSDLVLGVEEQGITWSFHNVAIPLAPVQVLDRKNPISLYYQIKSDAVRGDLRTTVSLFGGKGTSPDSAALQVSFEQAVQRGVNEIAPTIDVSHLNTGHYFLEVRITDAAGVVVSRRGVALDLE